MCSQSLGEHIPDPLHMLGAGAGSAADEVSSPPGTWSCRRSEREEGELGPENWVAGTMTSQNGHCLCTQLLCHGRQCLTFMLPPRCHPGAMSGSCRGTQRWAPAWRSHKTKQVRCTCHPWTLSQDQRGGRGRPGFSQTLQGGCASKPPQTVSTSTPNHQGRAGSLAQAGVCGGGKPGSSQAFRTESLQVHGMHSPAGIVQKFSGQLAWNDFSKMSLQMIGVLAFSARFPGSSFHGTPLPAVTSARRPGTLA